MKIAIDAMGGEKAPDAIIEGASLAAREYAIELALVGQPEAIERELSKCGHPLDITYDVVPASQMVGMDEPPLETLRRKKDTSISVATRLIKSGVASAVVSAGSTGAAMVAARTILGPLKGIRHPAIATMFPNEHGDTTVVLDTGANVDCNPIDLVEFAIMGQVYAEDILGKKHPRIGLLNIGEERLKGNRMASEAYELLSNAPVNFIGNVEGRDIFNGVVDVVICDGFIGNIILKVTEGVADTIMGALKEEFTRSITAQLSALLAKSALRRLKNRFDKSEYGGAPLLGVKGIVIIAHGGSSANAIKNAVRVASESVAQNVNAHIEAKLNNSKVTSVR